MFAGIETCIPATHRLSPSLSRISHIDLMNVVLQATTADGTAMSVGSNLPLQSIETDIRKVEREIEAVEKQISKLETQIEDAISEARNAADAATREKYEAEVKELRKEKSQLRDKEGQLRDDKKQLRDKEAVLFKLSIKASPPAQPGAYYVGQCQT